MKHNGHVLRKKTWLERAVATHNFHAERLKANSSWTITDTASSLSRSFGSIAEDLLIANWLKSHERQLRNFKYAKDALEFIREQKRRISLESL